MVRHVTGATRDKQLTVPVPVPGLLDQDASVEGGQVTVLDPYTPGIARRCG